MNVYKFFVVLCLEGNEIEIFNLNFEKKLYYDIFLLLNEFVSNSNNN